MSRGHVIYGESCTKGYKDFAAVILIQYCKEVLTIITFHSCLKKEIQILTCNLFSLYSIYYPICLVHCSYNTTLQVVP